MKVILNEREYTFLIGYQGQEKLRESFNKLAKKIFGITFEDWYQDGYWNEKYIPYTLFDGEVAVANASVNIMDFNYVGKQQRYIQIGTVLTDNDYRNRGLSRFIVEKICEEWNEKCDFIYLFANKTVLEMYPKFGFSRVKEYEHFKFFKQEIESRNLEKLNMDVQFNRDRLYDYAKHSKVFGRLALQENADLVMFYCTAPLKNNVYFIPSLGVIAVAQMENKKLHLLDVFSKHAIKLDDVIKALAGDQINEIVLGFTPEDGSEYEVREFVGDDVLFIQEGKSSLFENDKLRFPLLSHA